MSESIYNYVQPTGLIVPDVADLLTEVQAEWTEALGTGLNVDSSTPQGVMIAGEVAARTGVTQNNAAVANQINPNVSEGTFLDAISALTGLTRSANTFTTVSGVVLAGVPGSPIAASSQAKTPNGDVFALQSDVTLDPVTGQAVGIFVAMVAGPVAAPAGAWTIETDALGWETVTNPAVGVPGTAQQSDSALRIERVQTLAGQTVGFMEAALGALTKLPGVIGRQGLENTSSSAQTISTIAMTAKSVWFCVDGGAALDIANSLLRTKGTGAAWNGAVSQAVTEPASGQVYTVKWDVPTVIQLLCRVTCKQQNFVGQIVPSVTQAVLDYVANNIDGLQGFIVGQNASPFEIAAAVMSECPGLYVSKVELSLTGTVNYQPAEIAMAINQKASIISGNIAIVSS